VTRVVVNKKKWRFYQAPSHKILFIIIIFFSFGFFVF
jgi:hypothetical protein